jgi:N-acetylneuraminic acid mutarotase
MGSLRKIASTFRAWLALGLIATTVSAARADQPAATSSVCNTVNNCSFEAGTLTGWIASDIASPSYPMQVGGAGQSPGNSLFTSAPTDGNFAALNGFNGAGPGVIRLVQDISLPVTATAITFDYRAGWDMLGFPGSTQARAFIVDIEPGGGGPPMASSMILTADPHTRNLDTGNLSASIPVSTFQGQSIRVVFRWFIPENNTGPAFFQLDHVNVTVATTPTPPLLYGTSKAGSLFTVDLTTGAATYVGTIPIGSTEIEYDPTSHRAFVHAAEPSFAGQEFNINTGAAIGLPIVNNYSFSGLEWVGSTLYGTEINGPCANSYLRILNPWTGTSTLVGATGVTGPITGLAYHQPSGTMYGIGTGGCYAIKNLYQINLNTGLATVVGMLPFEAGSLEFGPDGNLYAGGTGQWGGLLYRIDRNNGNSLLVGETGFPDITGLTYVPPPPSDPCAGMVWETRASFSDPRASGAGIENGSASLIGSTIYVSHGTRATDSHWLSVYDIATNTWTHGGLSIPDAPVARSDLAGAAALGRHYAIGGRSGMSNLEEFNPLNATWATRAPLPTGRGGLGAATFANKIYAIGGRSGADLGQGTIYATNQIYKPLENTWTTLAPMPIPVSDNQATIAYAAKVYVFGGMDGGGYKNSVQIYDIAGDSWTLGTPMPTARAAAMAGVINGRIAVFGGYNGSSSLTTTEIYDPANDSWSTGPSMPVPLSEMAQGVTWDSKGIYAIGSGPFGACGTTVLRLHCVATPVAVPTAELTESFTIAPGPNPSRGAVDIRFALPGPTAVACEIVDVTGRHVWGTEQRSLAAGVHSFRWDGSTRSGSGAARGVISYA